MTAIAYGKGVIAAEQYHGRINAETFSSFVREHFARMFKKGANPKGKFFLQDGDLSQNSVKARSAWYEVGAGKFTILARSPDLNPPFKNIFHIDNPRSTDNPRRFYCTFHKSQDYTGTIPIDVVDRTILFIGKRINEIIKQKGQRIKY